ncbi:MAG: M23 family metallopeptidase [Fibrobacter sp.]|nr:M23 family metallopeptidase [Fibrobacter sp.]
MNKVRITFSRIILGCAVTLSASAIAEECDEASMDAFAYEDCVNTKNGAVTNDEDFGDKAPATSAPQVAPEKPKYQPFGKEAYLTSSFGENRGARYHAGLDYSTDMEEGWPIFAPEDGKVKELRTSPFGYGKVMFYQGNSGNTWVFAHQSSFGELDEAVMKQQYATKKNDVTIKPNKAFKKGDTLTFAGSTGIGNPHLHLEVRLDNDRVVNPRMFNTDASDSIAPQVFAAAVWKGNELAITSGEAIDKGCVISPVKNDDNEVRLAIKIADYSRLPKDNPMSVRRITMWRYDDKIFDKRLDTLNFKKMTEIRDQLLWAEEADTAGDWHVINARIAPISTYTLEVEDYAGNVTTKKFTFRNKCNGNKTLPMTKVQTAPVFTFLSRPMLDLTRCESGMKFSVLKGGSVQEENLCSAYKQENKPKLIGNLMERYPGMTGIRYSADNASGSGKGAEGTIAVFSYANTMTSVNWNTSIGEINISQKITGIPAASDPTVRILAVTKTHTDSLDYLEFHPKGMQLKNWNVCVENKSNPAPLYWLGETSRNWFIFSKQSKGKNRCVNVNELRDIASINNQEAPILGFPYWENMIINGSRQVALKIPLMFKYDGVADGNAITVTAKGKWIAAEYDSEPREIVIEGERVPETGETMTVQIVDEAGHKVSYDVMIPEM